MNNNYQPYTGSSCGIGNWAGKLNVSELGNNALSGDQELVLWEREDGQLMIECNSEPAPAYSLEVDGLPGYRILGATGVRWLFDEKGHGEFLEFVGQMRDGAEIHQSYCGRFIRIYSGAGDAYADADAWFESLPSYEHAEAWVLLGLLREQSLAEAIAAAVKAFSEYDQGGVHNPAIMATANGFRFGSQLDFDGEVAIDLQEGIGCVIGYDYTAAELLAPGEDIDKLAGHLATMYYREVIDDLRHD
jgi:hypothetical protein